MTEFITFGEIMLRLKSPAHERFFQSPTFEATFGGGEANVAVSLCNYGYDAAFVSALPDNGIGDAAIQELKNSAFRRIRLSVRANAQAFIIWKRVLMLVLLM